MIAENHPTYTVEPVELINVKNEHLTGVFCDFGEVIRARIARLRKSPSPMSEERAKFFQWLLEEVHVEDYTRLQKHYLDPSRLDLKSNQVKYIDPIYWFENKLLTAKQLGLDSRSAMKILDLGTGPGHFPVVARYYGHEVVGTDLPSRTSGVEKRAHLYDALCNVFKVRRQSLVIQPFERLPTLGDRYNLVTALLAAFNIDQDKQPWGIEAWRFFLEDLKENVLVQDGELYMSLARGKLTDEVWTYLKQKASRYNDDYKVIHITNMQAP